MKSLFVIITLFLFSCETKKYKYEVNKEIFYQDTLYDAVWYIDSYELNGDTLYYFNTDSSKVIIHPPYTIKEINKN